MTELTPLFSAFLLAIQCRRRNFYFDNAMDLGSLVDRKVYLKALLPCF